MVLNALWIFKFLGSNAGKIISASNAVSSGFALAVLAGLYFLQAQGLDLTPYSSAFGTTPDAFIIGAAWGVDILFTELSIRFPSIGTFGTSLKAFFIRILEKAPQVVAEYPATHPSQVGTSKTNLKTKDGDNVNNGAH